MVAETCWVLTEGHAGMENQALGLAEALGPGPVLKRTRPRAPWAYVPPWLWLPPLRAAGLHGDRLEPPWPDLLITCGRQGAALSMAIRRASRGRTFTIHIQNPRVHPRHFDLVVVPRHDGVTGENVIVTRAALHRVTPERLARARARFQPALAHLPRPLVAVLIGGSNRRYRVTPAVIAELTDRLAALARDNGAGLAVTPSRRTGAENEAVLKDRLNGLSAVIWDHRGENPYFGYLALADAIVVTSDSVSMVSEACATGKPVYVVELEGGSKRFHRFYRSLREDGITRPFDGTLEFWTYDPPDDTARAAAEARRRMAERRGLA